MSDHPHERPRDGHGPLARHAGAPGSQEPQNPDRAAAIAAAIRRAVVERRLPPGTKLPEDQIGALFGASRTLVRSALQALLHDGIVVLAKNRGAAVASPSIEEARHLFDARRALEDILVRRAAKAMTLGDRDSLSDLVERGRQALDADDRGTAIRLSGEFHLAIAAIARQPVLRSFLAELVSRTSLVIALYGRSRVTDCGEAEHRGLVEALAAADAVRAAALMAHHLDHVEAGLDLHLPSRPTASLARALRGAMISVEEPIRPE